MKRKDVSAEIENLNSSALFKAIMDNLRPSIKRVMGGIEWTYDKKTFLYKPKKRPKLSKEETYYWEVLQYSSNILKAFDRLNYAQIFIERFPQPRKYEKRGITEDKWIYYHYSNYVTTTVSIYDTALVLVNVIFALGLSPKNCNGRTVIENDHVRSTKVYSAMTKLNNIVEQYRVIRNKYIHRNEVPRINYLQFEESLSALQSWGQPMVDVKNLDKLYKITRSIIVDELQENTLSALNHTTNLLNTLLPEYKLRASIYQKSEELEKAVNEIVNKT